MLLLLRKEELVGTATVIRSGIRASVAVVIERIGEHKIPEGERRKRMWYERVFEEDKMNWWSESRRRASKIVIESGYLD